MIEINKKNNKNFDKKKISTIVGVILAIIVAVIIIAVSLSPNKSNDEITPDNSNQANITSVNVGETFELEGIKFTVESYEFRYYAHKGSYEAGTGKVWLMINAKIENPNLTRTKYDTVSESLYYITQDGEARYNSQYYNFTEWLDASNYLDPLEVARGYFMFNIPQNIAPIPNGYSYENGGKATNTQVKNFELRFQQNKIKPKDIIKIKL